MTKFTGCVLEYSDERIAALMREYERYIASCRYVRMSDAFNHIVNQPCPRFWVSNFRATVVIARMIKGQGKLKNMHPAKREMYQEIFRRASAMRQKYPEKSLYQIVSEVVQQPAPKFYLSASSAKIMFYKAKKEWYGRKQKYLLRNNLK